MKGDSLKWLVTERMKECLSTPNWPRLPTTIVSIELQDVGNGVLRMKVLRSGAIVHDYYTIKIVANKY